MFHISSNGPFLKHFNHTFVNTDIINIVITDINNRFTWCRTIRVEKILIIKFNNRICNIKLVNAVLPTFSDGFNHCRTIWRWYPVRGLVYGWWRKSIMNESEKISVNLSFNIKLVSRNVDRIIVPSIILGDNRIFINPSKNGKPY